MYSLVYEPGIPGIDPIDLSGEDYTVGQAVGLRSTQWSYALAPAGLSGVSASARETTLTVSARTPELFDRPNMIFDAEMSLGEPGTLVVDGQWRQRCYVTKTSTSAASRIVGVPSTQSWTVVLLDGVWTRLTPVDHFTPVTAQDTGLDLPTDMPFDLAAGGYTRYIQNDSLAPEDWIMTIFGPVTAPHITIGSNIIELTGSIPAGAYATIDSRTRTITLTDSNGQSQNVFDWGVRSTGVGSGNYVFERIPAGQQTVSWPSSFSFDLQLVESRTDPTWGGIRVIPVDAVHLSPITIAYGAGSEALAQSTTVKWSDGHTSVEPITWTNIPDTTQEGATLTATGMCAGQPVAQKITVLANMFSDPTFSGDLASFGDLDVVDNVTLPDGSIGECVAIKMGSTYVNPHVIDTAYVKCDQGDVYSVGIWLSYASDTTSIPSTSANLGLNTKDNAGHESWGVNGGIGGLSIPMSQIPRNDSTGNKWTYYHTDCTCPVTGLTRFWFNVPSNTDSYHLLVWKPYVARVGQSDQ